MNLLKSLLQNNPRRARVLMLLTLAVIAFALTAEGCPGDNKTKGGSSQTSNQVKTEYNRQPKYYIDIKNKSVKLNAGYIDVKVTIQVRRSGDAVDTGSVQVNWVAPKNSKYLELGGVHRRWGSGTAMIQFTDIDPNTGLSPEITVEYSYFAPWLKDRDTLVDTFYTFDQSISVSHDVSQYSSDGQSQSQAQAPAGPRASPPARIEAPGEEFHWLWRIWQLYYVQGVTMNTDLCQATTDFFQSESTFFALRFPVQPPPLTYTDPYTLPLVRQDPYTPTLKLWNYTTFRPDVTFTLEYMPRYHTFLENELPAAPGEHWMALGPSPTPTLTCPQDLNLEAGDWEYELAAYLDFGGQEDTCLGCNLPVYWCYEGQEAPFFLPTMAQSLGTSMTSYQGWDTTCVGPMSLRLGGGDLTVQRHHHAWITPTEEISFLHGVFNGTGQPLSVTLDVSSTLGLPWGIYSDTETFAPLPDPLLLGADPPDNSRWFAVHAEVPEDAPMGPETVLVTASGVSSPTLQAWASDLLWVGNWVAPPPSPDFNYLVYLPTILR